MNWEKNLILWDGDCGFCRHAVDWALAHDRRGVLAAIPYQAAPAPPLTPALRAGCRHAVHVITRDGRTLRAGRACLFVLSELGWRRSARLLAAPPFIWAVEVGYKLVARHRARLSRLRFGAPACGLR